MTVYKPLLTLIAGSAAVRLLRAVLAVYQLADFCSGSSDLPVPPRLNGTVEALLALSANVECNLYWCDD